MVSLGTVVLRPSHSSEPMVYPGLSQWSIQWSILDAIHMGVLMQAAPLSSCWMLDVFVQSKIYRVGHISCLLVFEGKVNRQATQAALYILL